MGFVLEALLPRPPEGSKNRYQKGVPIKYPLVVQGPKLDPSGGSLQGLAGASADVSLGA